MKIPMIAAAALLALAGAVAADDDCNVPMDQWQPREAVVQLAAKEGWQVQRIKVDDGCYEVRGTDPEGHRIKVKLDPGTLERVQMTIYYRK